MKWLDGNWLFTVSSSATRARVCDEAMQSQLQSKPKEVLILATGSRAGSLARGCCGCRKLRGEKKEAEPVFESCFESFQRMNHVRLGIFLGLAGN